MTMRLLELTFTVTCRRHCDMRFIIRCKSLRSNLIGLVAAYCLLATHTALTATNANTSQSLLAVSYGQLPLTFEPNRGQYDSRVQYLARGPGYALFLTPQESVQAFNAKRKDGKYQGGVLRTHLLGARE